MTGIVTAVRGRQRLGASLASTSVRLLDLRIAPRPSAAQHRFPKPISTDQTAYIHFATPAIHSIGLHLRQRAFTTSVIRQRASTAVKDQTTRRRVSRLGPSSPESDHLAARRWLDAFEAGGAEDAKGGHHPGGGGLGIPASAYEMTMSRSSGPGGQNVNKLSTKATIRLALPSPLTSSISGADNTATDTDNTELELWNDWLPWFVVPSLWKSVYYASDPPSLLLSCSSTRYAHTNRQLALDNLHAHICDVASTLIVNPTSEAQKAKVRALEGKEKARRKREKELGKSKKQGRRKGGWD